MRRKHPEDDIQRAQVKYLESRRDKVRDVMFCAVPNGGKRGKVEAARFVGLGVVPGAPDLILWKKNRCIGVENKVKGNYPTDAQKAFGEAMQALGHEYHVITATDPTDAVNQLHDLLEAA